MEKKNMIKANKYGFLEDEEEVEADEVLKNAEKYFDTELFVQQEENDEVYSDEELSNI